MIEPCCSYELPEGRYIIPDEQLDAPTGVEAESSGTDTIDVTWDEVEDAETYTVQYREAGEDDWSSLGPVSDTEAEITGLEADTEYEIQVIAHGSGWLDSDPSDIVTATTGGDGPNQLPTPTGVAAVADGTDAIDIEWEAVEDADEYTVEYREVGEDDWISSGPVEGTSTTISDLDADTEYELRVIAHAEGFDDSDPSDPVTATTEDDEPQLATPQDLASQGQGATNIEVDWSAVTDAEEYIVRWALEGTTDWTESDPVEDTEYDITGLAEETSYDIQVSATADGFSQSEWSDTLTAETALD